LTLFVGCGEASGDRYAARIAESLRLCGYGGELFGRVGHLGEAAGIRRDFDAGELAILGITEAIGALPRLRRALDGTAQAIRDRNPDAVILIDAPDFHLPLARRIRALGYGGPIVDVAPPTVWAWRRGRLRTLRGAFTLCLPLFAFEHRFLAGNGVRSLWRGHPLLDDWSGRPCRPPAEGDRRIALLPGSRQSEVLRLLPVLEDAARRLAESGFEPVFSVAPGLREETADLLGRRLARSGFRTDGAPGADLMARSACVIGASGTATLEALLSDRYMVVLFRTGLLNWTIARLFIRTPYIGIPNLVAEEPLFPELIQDRATGEGAAAEARAYLDSPERRKDRAVRMDSARRRLGRPGVYRFWAESLLALIEERTR
jgi:lipid-A-disaccharide synthase